MTEFVIGLVLGVPLGFVLCAFGLQYQIEHTRRIHAIQRTSDP